MKKRPIPQVIHREMEALTKRLPQGAPTFQAGLFQDLLALLLEDREALRPFEASWQATGYIRQYPNAKFHPALVETTRQNLVRTLRTLHQEGKTGYLWWVEKIRGQGYRLRVVDEAASAALTGDWAFRDFDPDARTQQHRILFLQDAPVKAVVPARPGKGWGWAFFTATLLVGFMLGQGMAAPDEAAGPFLRAQVPLGAATPTFRDGQAGQADRRRAVWWIRSLSPEERQRLVKNLPARERERLMEALRQFNAHARHAGRVRHHVPPAQPPPPGGPGPHRF